MGVNFTPEHVTSFMADLVTEATVVRGVGV